MGSIIEFECPNCRVDFDLEPAPAMGSKYTCPNCHATHTLSSANTSIVVEMEMTITPTVKITAPFTPAQVEVLNRYQHIGIMHEFTCGGADHPAGADKRLVATEAGWVCPSCPYTQDWAHAFMADPEALDRAEEGLKNLMSAFQATPLHDL